MALDARMRVHNSEKVEIAAFSAKILPQADRHSLILKFRELIEAHFDLGSISRKTVEKLSFRDLVRRKTYSVDTEEQYQLHKPALSPESYDIVCE